MPLRQGPLWLFEWTHRDSEMLGFPAMAVLCPFSSILPGCPWQQSLGNRHEVHSQPYSSSDSIVPIESTTRGSWWLIYRTPDIIPKGLNWIPLLWPFQQFCKHLILWMASLSASSTQNTCHSLLCISDHKTRTSLKRTRSMECDYTPVMSSLPLLSYSTALREPQSTLKCLLFTKGLVRKGSTWNLCTCH